MGAPEVKSLTNGIRLRIADGRNAFSHGGADGQDHAQNHEASAKHFYSVAPVPCKKDDKRLSCHGNPGAAREGEQNGGADENCGGSKRLLKTFTFKSAQQQKGYEGGEQTRHAVSEG